MFSIKRVQPVPEIIKILRLPQPIIGKNNSLSCVNFGPFDNGYILLGTESGHLLILDPKNLKRVCMERVFKDSSVSAIDLEPT